MSHKPLDRRTFLKGLGTLMAIPVLEGMAPITYASGSGAIAANPTRMAFLFVPNGINMAEWTPAAAGPLQISPILQPLAEVQKDISILTGLSQQNAFALGLRRVGLRGLQPR